MAEFFKKLFQFLFGWLINDKSDTEEQTQDDHSGSDKPKTDDTGDDNKTPPVDDTTDDTHNEGKDIGEHTFTLIRHSYGKQDTLGKLYFGEEELALTLEGTKENHLAEGTYNIILRTEGGRHATYWYKFGDLHKGMLAIDGVDNYPDIHIGNLAVDAQNGIVVGTQFQKETESESPREIWYSERGYEKVYSKMATPLTKGKKVTLLIKKE